MPKSKTEPSRSSFKKKQDGLCIIEEPHEESKHPLSDIVNKYHTLFENARDAIYIVDQSSARILDANSVACELYGYTLDEIRELRIVDISAEPEKTILTIQEESVQVTQRCHKKKDGMAFPVEITGRTFCMDGRNIHVAFVRDITDRKRSEDLLKRVEAKYRSIFENSVEGIYQSTIDGLYTEVNPAFARIFGYDSPEELINTKAKLLYVDPESRDECVRILQEQGTGNFEVHFRKKDGSTGWVTNHVQAVRDANGRITHFDGVIVDITERKRMEEVLKKSREELEIKVAERTAELARSNEQLTKEIEERKEAEELYKALTNSSYTGIYILQEGMFQFLNPRAAVCFGYTPDELMGVESISIIHPHDRYMARKNAIDMLRGERNAPYEFRVLTKNKNIRWIMESIIPIHFKGKPALLGNSTDFTEFKEAVQKVKEHESIETSILDAIPHPVVGLHNRCIIFANNAVESVFGWSTEELIGKKSRIFYRSDEEYEEIGKVAYHTLANQRTWSSEFFCRHRDGHDIICRLNAAIIGGDLKDRKIVVVYEDITQKKQAENEKKNLEAQLGQAQKMEAIGTLAGGIAHDFNNILGAVLGNIELALLDLEKDNHLRRYLERTLKASERAVDLVKQILTFSRQGEKELRPLIVNPVIKEAMKLLRATLPAKIEIRQNISYDKYVVIADPTQIHQVIMNLCTNAAHAMRKTGGILEIGLSHTNISIDVPFYFPNLPPGPYLELVVRDTGHGIEPEVIDKIFDPFFTTKRAGEGTGMGLAVVYGIVKSCGGEIRVESEPGKRTAFFVYLPIVIDKTVASEIENIISIPRGQERILFVDDEEDIAQLTEDILSRLGYKVITEVSSLVALRVFRAKPDLFDLVITDMNMPNMTGIELAREMLKVRPDIPIILCTGFSELVTPEKAKSIGIRELMMKPIVMRQLAEAIRRVLDKG